ncbi:hypothetical protein BSLG_003384 [Batrachochytrium salamandrivorans]|nr:hypothetical protein BSLG_003384 [Batrachochytrium salamandrivorans]
MNTDQSPSRGVAKAFASPTMSPIAPPSSEPSLRPHNRSVVSDLTMGLIPAYNTVNQNVDLHQRKIPLDTIQESQSEFLTKPFEEAAERQLQEEGSIPFHIQLQQQNQEKYLNLYEEFDSEVSPTDIPAAAAKVRFFRSAPPSKRMSEVPSRHSLSSSNFERDPKQPHRLWQPIAAKPRSLSKAHRLLGIDDSVDLEMPSYNNSAKVAGQRISTLSPAAPFSGYVHSDNDSDGSHSINGLKNSDRHSHGASTPGLSDSTEAEHMQNRIGGMGDGLQLPRAESLVRKHSLVRSPLDSSPSLASLSANHAIDSTEAPPQRSQSRTSRMLMMFGMGGKGMRKDKGSRPASVTLLAMKGGRHYTPSSSDLDRDISQWGTGTAHEMDPESSVDILNTGSNSSISHPAYAQRSASVSSKSVSVHSAPIGLRPTSPTTTTSPSTPRPTSVLLKGLRFIKSKRKESAASTATPFRTGRAGSDITP